MMCCVIDKLQNIGCNNLIQLDSPSCSTEKGLFQPFAKVSLVTRVAAKAPFNGCSVAVDRYHISVS